LIFNELQNTKWLISNFQRLFAVTSFQPMQSTISTRNGTFTADHDSLGRRTSRTLPGGQTETIKYILPCKLLESDLTGAKSILPRKLGGNPHLDSGTGDHHSAETGNGWKPSWRTTAGCGGRLVSVTRGTSIQARIHFATQTIENSTNGNTLAANGNSDIHDFGNRLIRRTKSDGTVLFFNRLSGNLPFSHLSLELN
jgi:YD repeat-containing protein